MLLVTSMAGMAQKSDEKKREFMQMKMEFIADKIGLKNELRQKFFDTYSQLENERWQLFKKKREIEKNIKNKKNASDSEYDKAYQEIQDLEAKISALEKTYEAKFIKFLSKKQIIKMREAEDEFKQKMKKCRDKKSKEKKTALTPMEEEMSTETTLG